MKTLKKVEVVPVYVEFIPENMEFGKIYISKKYEGTNHLCLCGCGHQCYLPICKGEWTLNDSNGKVTMIPSILQRFECKSHYIITNNIANFV